MRVLSQKTMFALHGLLGIKLAVLMTVICLTGSLATISHELDWLSNPAIRVAPDAADASGARAGDIPWSGIQTAVQTARPDWQVRSINAPLYANFAAEVLAVTPEGQLRRVYVDPYRLIVQGDTTYLNVQRFLRSLHMGLFLPQIGIYVVSFFGFVVLGSVITGILVYKRFWRSFFRLRMNRGARIFWGDAHKLVGLWSLPFTTIIALTSIWYFVEMAMYDTGTAHYEPDPKISEDVLRAAGPRPRLPLDDLVAKANTAYPALTIRTIYLPFDARDAIRFDGQATAMLVRNRANRVYLNPYSGAVMKVQKIEERGLDWRWVDTADELHFGTFGGLATKLLWLVLGLLTTGLVVSGSWLWLRRSAQLLRPEPASRFSVATNGAG